MKMTSLVTRAATLLTVAALLFTLVQAAGGLQPVEALGKPELRRALLATVRVAVPIDGQKDSYSTGSGTILTADGYILTNFHVMGDVKKGKLYNKQGVAMIAINPSDLKSLPTWTYQAAIVKGDPNIDLAVLKIIAPFKGGGTLPANLGLVVMPIGDSDKVEIGDAVSTIGYPGIGGDSVTYTSGSISGFLDDDGDKVIDWFKTDAEVNHGNSGGLAINDAGEMIGVPTAGITEDQGTGKISLIRPISRGMALIKAAIVGGSGQTSTPSAIPTPSSASSARITSLVFTESVDASNRPGQAANSFAAGTTTIYAAFQYQNFTDGQVFKALWNRDGQPDVTTELEWDAGDSGNYWVSITNQRGIIEGAYELTLSLNGVALRQGRITVGAAATPAEQGAFGAVSFAEGVTADEKPLKPHSAGEGFISGSTQIYAFAPHKNMEEGASWTNVWYIDGEPVLSQSHEWEWEADGTFWVSLTSKKGLPDGDYTLRLFIGDKLAGEGTTQVGTGGVSLIDEGVQVMGEITDADTGRAIPGAVFIVLNPGVSARSFLSDPQDSDVYGGGEADAKGQFTLSTLLERGQSYSIVVGARGYQPAYQDDYEIAEDEESPLEFSIELQQR